MIINVTYDSSVAGAPAGFTTAIADAVEFYETMYANPITINIDVGWGEIDGQTIGPNALSESESNLQGYYTYAQIRAALADNATTSIAQTALASLPASDPTDGGRFLVTNAEAKALGLLPATASGVDGYIGFNSSDSFTVNPDDRGVSGSYDLIGAAEHEISEVLGRVSDLQSFDQAYEPLDLFRYSAPGVRQLTTGAPSYFSINGGVTDLGDWNNYVTGNDGDLGDWAPDVGNDSYLDVTNPGVENPVTQRDLDVMSALGYELATNPIVISGQTLDIASAETINNLGILAGGAVNVLAGGLSTGATVSGVESVYGAATNATVNDGGSLDVFAGGTVTGTVIGGGAVILASGAIVSGEITFAGGGVLEVAGTALPTNIISGFTTGDTIDLASIAVSSGGSAILETGNVLQVSIEGNTYDLNLDPSQNFIDAVFALSSDGSGGTDIANSPTAEITLLYEQVLGRAPDSSGLQDWVNALIDGDTIPQVRTAFADSSEAQGDLTLIYQQILGRAPDMAGLANWTTALADGMSLAAVHAAFADSPEAQGDLTLIYQQVLGRAPDTAGLASWTTAMADGMSLQTVRTDIAGSPEAQGDLIGLFQSTEGRAPDVAELAGMQNQLAATGASLTSLQASLDANGPTGFTVVSAPSGNIGLTALAGPERFDFSAGTFGNDTIAGFNQSQDAIEVSHTLAANFAAISADMSSVGGGTAIAFDASQSITLLGIAPAVLVAANFHIV